MPDRPPDPPCGCGGCREFRAITAEPREELPRHMRQQKRKNDRRTQRQLEEQAAVRDAAMGKTA